MSSDFIDIQVNGYAGIDFNNPGLTREQLQKIAQRLREGKVEAILATVVTSTMPRMTDHLATLVKLIDADPSLRKLIPAFHIEGPCISPEDGYKGAHPQECVQPASPEVFKPLLEAAGGAQRVALVTLAPEMDAGLRTTRWLVEQGIRVALGHSNASLDCLREAEQAGACLYTHLGNGCASLIPRHDNVLNRVMSLEKIKVSLVPDGYHVPWFLLRNWIKWFGIDRCIFTTDCVSAADAPPGIYKIGYWELEVGPDKKVHPPGKDHLAGSALTMREAYDNGIQHIGLSPADCRKLCVDNPRALIGKWLKP
jgi:N-acetylglucosamine-6-phosphate deacetylase